jgi:CHAT domain-containing protein/tetratricopeptide (TPR) repeat protein
VEQLNNLGGVFFLQASYLRAFQAYRGAEERVERAAGAPWQGRRQRITLSNVAALLQRLGAYEQALEVYRRLQGAPEALAPSEQARMLTNLGALYRRLEDPVKALDTYAAARRLFERERHRDGEIKVLKNIGIVQALDLADPAAALATFSDALALAERDRGEREAMQLRLYRGGALSRAGDLVAARRELEAALASARALGTTEEEWKALDALGRVARAEGRDDLAEERFRAAVAAIESVRSGLVLPALKTDFLADRRDAYEALVDLVAARSDAAEVFGLLERSRARAFQDRLRPRGEEGDARVAALAEVRARLAPGTLLLEYWLAPGSAGVVWATRDAAGLARLPVDATGPEALSSFVKEVSSGEGDGWRSGSRALGEALLSAVAPLSDPALRHLVIVPDGALAALPFEALALPGGGALVIDRFDVSYAPSASILLRGPRPAWRSWSPPWKRHLLAFADPRVSAGPGGALAEALGGGAPEERLPASADEVRAIARLVRPGRSVLHLGAADQKRFLVDGRAAGVDVLHLATHATADEASPERSRILFSPEVEQDGADYLFLREVYDLDLHGVDLATLSACDTERGKVIRGEGLQAFSRALLSAGSRAAVTALWRVADRPTGELMKQLYFELSRREPKAEALRRAKLRLLRSETALAHPRYWAAFVLNGDGRAPVPLVVPWSALAAPLLGVLAAAALLAGRRKAGPRVTSAAGAGASRGTAPRSSPRWP